ncbi:DUF371 domain-containing protein [archaeon]|nr:DUF371 domain-containing protein [archaeon]MBT6824355.1 DUF371 domain-containing protein [archaeon]MBT7297458.1 DUF371 domain-containing protein [archaeon]
MKFKAYGHENVLATHKNTFEFTKDNYLTKQGDCIVGIKLDKLPKAITGLIKIIISVDGFKEYITAEANPKFKHESEFVIRISGFLDDRTYAIRADKAAKDFSREMIEILKNPNKEIEIEIINY